MYTLVYDMESATWNGYVLSAIFTSKVCEGDMEDRIEIQPLLGRDDQSDSYKKTAWNLAEPRLV